MSWKLRSRNSCSGRAETVEFVVFVANARAMEAEREIRVEEMCILTMKINRNTIG